MEIVYEIVDCNGKHIGYIKANSERQALCLYLAYVNDLNDVMLWQSITGVWKLAKYDDEENYIFAREV